MTKETWAWTRETCEGCIHVEKDYNAFPCFDCLRSGVRISFEESEAEDD